MVAFRSYEDPCGIARALDRVGERWALLVVRELLLGPKRFTDLSEGLPGMSRNVLSQRLVELEQSGVVTQRLLGPPTSAWVYELTAWGRELEPVVMALARWGSQAPRLKTGALSADAFMLALRTTFDAHAAGDHELTAQLQLEHVAYIATIRAQQLTVARGAAVEPLLTLSGRVATLQRLVFGDLDLDDALARGVDLVGTKQHAKRFLRLFRRPVAQSTR